MALGDSNNNNRRKYYEPNVTSPYGVSNTDGIDPSALSYRFTLGMLVISIAPMLPSAKPDDQRVWDHDNEVSIWLTHYNAKMLLNEIEYMQAHPDAVNNGGVFTKSGGLISFSNGKELGASEVISEEVAKTQTENVLDFFIRDNEGSNAFYLFIANGAKSSEIIDIINKYLKNFLFELLLLKSVIKIWFIILFWLKF